MKFQLKKIEIMSMNSILFQFMNRIFFFLMNLLLYLKTFLLLYSAFMNLMKDLCQDDFSESKSILFRWINQKINWNLEIGLFEWKL